MPNKSFRGGIHPLRHEGKLQTRNIPIRELIPSTVIIPMSMHLGAPSVPCVKKGDHVLVGQLIGEPQGFLGLPVHSSISGTVISVQYRQQLGTEPVQCIEIENDFNDESVEFTPRGSVEEVDPREIPDIIKNAGICGMGGATFPTHVKFAVPDGKKCDTVIINGAECETHLTSDFRLMIEHPERVVDGLRASMRALGVSEGVICIEDNKPEAIEAIKKAASNREGVKVMTLKTKYPQGSEKQLIKAVTEREVPAGGLPIDIGVIVLNAATSLAIADAIQLGRPLISRITTVTGDVNEPANLHVRIGTPLTDVIGACGGYKGNVGKIVMGGTMTGACAPNGDISIIKGSGGVIVFDESHAHILRESPCIRCARCVEVCPMGLLPYAIKSACKRNDINTAKQHNMMDCMLCGCCSFICPSSRYLTPAFKGMKDKIAAEARRNKK